MIFHVICSMFVISLAQVSAFFSHFVEGRQAHLCMHSFHSSPPPLYVTVLQMFEKNVH